MDTKITKGGYVWLLLDEEQANALWRIMDVYCLYNDDTGSLIKCPGDLDNSGTYGIEVGFLNDLQAEYDELYN